MKRKITVVMAVELDVEGEGDKMQLAERIVHETRFPQPGSCGDMVYHVAGLDLSRVSVADLSNKP